MDTTIAAISTGLTPSGIIIIRMSGPDSVNIADKVFKSRMKKAGKPSAFKTHTLHLGYIEDGGSVIDEVLLSVMKAPRTFTGEDIVEINCHGGVLVSKKVLELLLRSGAVPAEPGEFAKRAFMHGRIDLTKAEAVIDLINAKNDFALKAGASQLKGNVNAKVMEIREKILYEVSYIEAALDDPEHYDLTDYGEELGEKLGEMASEVKRLLARADFGSTVKEGIRTVIAGRPNAGKSSLLNLLSGYEKAIVTDVAGTTRDILEEEIVLGNLSLILMDTAGIRNTQDIVEKIGVTKAKDALKEADLVLYLIDSTVGMTEEDREVLSEIGDKQVILLMNKADLCELSDAACETERLRVLPFSALTGQGLEKLEELILSLFDRSEIGYNDEVMITSVRQKNLLREAYEAFGRVREGIDAGMSEDFLTIDLMGAYEALGKIIGEEVGEDVINTIFSEFCMGK